MDSNAYWFLMATALQYSREHNSAVRQVCELQAACASAWRHCVHSCMDPARVKLCWMQIFHTGKWPSLFLESSASLHCLLDCTTFP